MEQKVGLIDRVAMLLKIKPSPKAKPGQKAARKTGNKTVKISRRH